MTIFIGIIPNCISVTHLSGSWLIPVDIRWYDHHLLQRWRLFRIVLWVSYFVNFFVGLYIFCHHFDNHHSILCLFFPDVAIHCCNFLKHEPYQSGVIFLCPLVNESWHLFFSCLDACFPLCLWVLFIYTLNDSAGILNCGSKWNIFGMTPFPYIIEHFLDQLQIWLYPLSVHIHRTFNMLTR